MMLSFDEIGGILRTEGSKVFDVGNSTRDHGNDFFDGSHRSCCKRFWKRHPELRKRVEMSQ